MYRIGCLLIVAGACTVNGPDGPEVVPTPEAEQAMWVLAHDGAANWLYRVNATTFAIERESNLGAGALLWELAGIDGTAYAIDRDADTLVAIDLAAAAFGPAVKLGGDMLANGRGFGTGTSGALYGNFGGTLAVIDPSTGALLDPVPLELGATTEAVEGCAGQLFTATRESGSPKGEKLYRVDPASGKAVLVGAIGSTPIDIDTLACGFDGELYGVDTDPTLGRIVFRIDRASGARTQVVELPVSGPINGIHFAAL